MPVFNAVLVGGDTSYSISPRVHEELFRILSPRYASSYTSIGYLLVDITERCDFATWLKTARSNGINGVNVTMPFKDDAYELATRHKGVSSILQSANTLRLGDHSEITAVSTDGQGLLNALMREYPTINLEHYHLVTIGAGSAARAALYALCSRWMPQSLTIVNRTPSYAEELAEFCIAQAPGPSVRVMSFEEFIASYPEPHYRFVIQSTPMGNASTHGNPIEDFNWQLTDFALDLTYNPLRTPFLKRAEEAGAKIMNGLGMLIEQAALAQSFWLTGILQDDSPLSQDEFKSIVEIISKDFQ